MAQLLQRLRMDGSDQPPGQQSNGSDLDLVSIYEVVQESILNHHVEVLRAARKGGHGRQVLERSIERILVEKGFRPQGLSRRALVQELTSRILGYGPLDRILQDGEVSEIMVNGCKKVYVEKSGQISRTEVAFADDNELVEVIRRLVGGTGRRIDTSSPYVDARLPDGSRLNAVLPPLAVDGPTLTIRRFPGDPLTCTELLKLGSLSEAMVEFLKSCVNARLNCLVSGGTATGKTTLLNILAGFIDDPLERIISLEDAAELNLDHEHRVSLETRPANVEGQGEITLQHLLRNALRMRPDRIIIGEVRGPEAYDLLQALNTGHDGSLSTVHANSPRDALDRVESMALMAGNQLPPDLIRRQLVSAVDVIVHLKRLGDGSRVISDIALVQLAADEDLLLPVYRHVAEGIFRPQVRRLPDWATAWWTDRGLQAPRLHYESAVGCEVGATND